MIRKILLLLFMTVFIFYGMVLTAGDMSFEEQRARSVKILAGKYKGSGFFIDGNTVLTARHVVEREGIQGDVHVQLLKIKLPAKVTYMDKRLDIALISLDVMLPFKPVEFRSKKGGKEFGSVYSYPGTVQFAVDYPVVKKGLLTMRMTPETQLRPVYAGVIATDDYFEHKQKHGILRVMICPIFGPGSSGAGVLDSESKLMGVISTATQDLPGVGGMVPSEQFYIRVKHEMMRDDVEKVLD